MTGTTGAWVAEPVGDPRHRLGEGPHWDAARERLSWVDIPRGELWVEGSEPLVLGDDLGVAVPHEAGGWTCGLGRGIALVSEQGEVLHRTEVEPEGVRMNDGKCDRLGRFFVGSKAHDNAAGAGTLWRLDLDGTITPVVRGLTISNGLGWSLDDTTMYVTDSAVGRIDAYDYDLASGRLGARRPFFEAADDQGSPDGLTVDAEGCLWVAFWGAGRVRRFSPAGELMVEVRVAASHTTSCAFTGADLGALAITTAWDELTAEQRAAEPDAGRRFVVQVGSSGLPGEPCRVSSAPWRAQTAAS